MPALGRRAIWLLVVTVIVVPVLLVVVLGLLLVWSIWSFLAGPAPIRYDTPTQLASVSVPSRPSSLAWSPDGTYLVTGTWGTADGERDASEVFVVDVANASVTTTLKTTAWVEGVAFSPDGKWLAVATRQSNPAGAAPAELVVFDVPAFTAKFTARAGGPENGFIDLAWTADGKALHATDGPLDYAQGKAEVRGWDVPAFTERPAIGLPQAVRYRALAVSPDGRTLAVAEQTTQTTTNARTIRLFDPGKGTEQSSFKTGDDTGSPRLGFTADGKALGVYDGQSLSWWDPATGRPAKPDPARFATQLAGLSDERSRYALSPDGSWQARGYEHHRDFGDLGWDNRGNEFGAFVEVTASARAKTWTWRVGAPANAPAVAISPDGTRIAGTVTQPGGESILIWAAPK
jgi:WD40 repeat protein